MGWPSGTDYQAAVQHPQAAFSDPELKTCRVKTNLLGLPMPYSGGFATVYRLQNHQEWAVRCFRREVGDLGKRYDAIQEFVERSGDQAFVAAEHIQRGIRVKGSWYPVIKMEWVKGDPLQRFLEKHVDDSVLVSDLACQFRALAWRLEQLGIAHGDLQHGNILVAGRKLYLVDYDSIYLPAIASLGPTTPGHRNYQHPMRDESCYGPHSDRFSCLVIYLALLALAASPGLLREYDDDDSVLFHRKDFEAPEKSRLLSQLSLIPSLTTHVEHFAAVCRLPIARLPTLDEFIRGRIPTPPSTAIAALAPPPGKWHQYAVLDARDKVRAMNYVGQRVEVIGRIDDIHKDHTRYRQPYCFLNVGRYPGQTFTFVLWKPGLEAFRKSRGSAEHLIGQWVRVVGVVSAYRGRPQMEIEVPSQIRGISNDEATALLGTEVHVAIDGRRRDADVLNTLYRDYPSTSAPSAPYGPTRTQEGSPAGTPPYQTSRQPQPTAKSGEAENLIGCVAGLALGVVAIRLAPDLGVVALAIGAVVGFVIARAAAKWVRDKF